MAGLGEAEWTSVAPVTLAESATHYLDTLATQVPDCTYQSHQTALTKFLEWSDDKDTDVDGLPEQFITEYVGHLQSDSDLAVDTAAGHIGTLSNFISYLYQQDPEIIKAHIVSNLQQIGSPDLTIVGRRISSFENRPPRREVETLLQYLRHRQFGTRIHAFTELLLDTRSRPEQVRQVNLTDLNICDHEVIIGIPDTHLVSTVGLVTERQVDLTETTAEAVETYIQYEREEPQQNDCEPVFTTTQGRASATTVRRSVKQASETANSSFALQSPSGTDLDEVGSSSSQSQPLGPQDIWQHALTTVPDY